MYTEGGGKGGGSGEGRAIAETMVSRRSVRHGPRPNDSGFERFPFADKSRAILQPSRVKMCTRLFFFFFFYVISIIYLYICMYIRIIMVREKMKISSRNPPRSRNLISIVVGKEWTSFRISMTNEQTILFLSLDL